MRFVSSGTPGTSQKRVNRSHWLMTKVSGSHSGELGSTSLRGLLLAHLLHLQHQGFGAVGDRASARRESG
jgi:hypothetical protein